VGSGGVRYGPPVNLGISILPFLATAGVAGIAIVTTVATVAGVAVLSQPSPAPSPAPSEIAVLPSASPSPTPSPSPSPSPSPTPSPTPAGPDRLLGTDGRFTILLLGSDYRPAHPGNRTDVIMVASVDPTTGATAVVSIPRDTARFPLPGGGVYPPKVNGLYQSYISRYGVDAGRRIKQTVGAALGVEIDSFAVVGFEGVRQLINAVGGVDVVLKKTVHDPDYWVSSRVRGVTFPAGRNHLSGDRALIFARTRKGDNDFERARRQQLLVAAAVAKVRSRGLAVLPTLLRLGRTWIKTDLPLAEAPRIWDLMSRAKVSSAKTAVLGPRTYAVSIGGTSFALRLNVVRALIDAWMPPVAPPRPSPSPSASTSPAVSAEPSIAY